MDVLTPINAETLLRIKAYRDRLTEQQYKTLRGQVLAGDSEAALKGLRKILRRKPTNPNSIILPSGEVHTVRTTAQGRDHQHDNKTRQSP